MSNRFTVNDGLKYEFEKRFIKESHGESAKDFEPYKNEFPVNMKDLVEKYCQFERILNDKWHSNTNLGASVSGKGCLLTDHGPNHINEVIYYAYLILGSQIKYLTGYEIYLLLLSIHFHDLGNIYGREKHEDQISKAMDEMGKSLELDRVEQEFVLAIAQAHGGQVNGDKDTIRYVSVDETCNGVLVRAKVLSAILRFADELSDDFYRSDFPNIEIPVESEVYHEYSKSLEPVSIEGETVKFHFRIPYELTQKKVGKGEGRIYLYDEIIDRLAKCMRELEYCKKYAHYFINLTTFSVRIDILGKKDSRKTKERISFRLGLTGYPNPDNTKLTNYLLSEYPVDNNGNNSFKYNSGDTLKVAMEE